MSPVTEPIDTLHRIQEASFARASEATRRAFPSERRMDGATLLRFLAGRNAGVLATVRPDGRPHAAPARFALVGTRFVFVSPADAARIENLRHEPHASLVVLAEHDASQAVVVAEGTTRLLEPMEASLEMRAPFRGGPDGALPSWVGFVVVLTPERLLSYAPEGFGP